MTTLSPSTPAFPVASQVVHAIQGATRVLCVSHVAPDGDAVGSLLGMGWMLHRLGKETTLALPDSPPQEFAYVPGVENIVSPEAVGADFDLIICLDASSPDRMGAVYRPADHDAIPLLVIDHHVTNTYFGDLNWVEPGCAATCQMLVYLADALHLELTGELAVSLLTGLVTDTLGFRTSNTDARVLAAATRLVEGGAPLSQIVADTLSTRTFASVRLWGAALADVQLEDGIIWAVLRRADRERIQARDEDGDGLASFLVTVKEADISATFTERLDEQGAPYVACSFRAKPGFDVSSVAVALGGGGHPPAAGCTLPGVAEDVVDRVITALRTARRRSLDGRTPASTTTLGVTSHGSR